MWQTNVAGAVYQTTSNVPGYDTLHVSAGARAGDLVINSNGTYTWQSYGGKKGRWIKGNAEYPVVLIDTVENRKWQVGFDKRNPGRIFIWDGNAYTYNGRR